jgi:hypothetical protein
MLYNTELLGFFYFVRSPVSWRLENTTFQKLDLFSSLGEGGKTPISLGPLETADLIHWTEITLSKGPSP